MSGFYSDSDTVPPAEESIPWTPSDGPKRRSKRPLLFAGITALVVGGGIAAALLWPTDASTGCNLVFGETEPVDEGETCDHDGRWVPREQPLEEAAQVLGSYAEIADEGHTLIIDGWGEESDGAAYASIASALDALDAPASVTARMNTTRALDGMQEASWGDFTATWTYHPDNGLDLIITEVG